MTRSLHNLFKQCLLFQTMFYCFKTMFIVSNNVALFQTMFNCFKFFQKCNLLPVVFQFPSRRWWHPVVSSVSGRKISEQEMWVEGEFASRWYAWWVEIFGVTQLKPLYLLVYLLCKYWVHFATCRKKIQHLKVCNAVNNSGWGIAEEPDQGHQSGMWETPWMD